MPRFSFLTYDRLCSHKCKSLCFLEETALWESAFTDECSERLFFVFCQLNLCFCHGSLTGLFKQQRAGGLVVVGSHHPSSAKPVPGARFVVTSKNVHIMPFFFARQVKEPFALSNTNSLFVTRMDIRSFPPCDKALRGHSPWAGPYRPQCYSKI